MLEGTVFDEANREASRRRLEGIKVLTLRLAQRIAEENNQSFLATYHAVNAARMRYYQSLGAYAPEITAEPESARRWSGTIIWSTRCRIRPPGISASTAPPA